MHHSAITADPWLVLAPALPFHPWSEPKRKTRAHPTPPPPLHASMVRLPWRLSAGERTNRRADHGQRTKTKPTYTHPNGQGSDTSASVSRRCRASIPAFTAARADYGMITAGMAFPRLHVCMHSIHVFRVKKTDEARYYCQHACITRARLGSDGVLQPDVNPTLPPGPIHR